MKLISPYSNTELPLRPSTQEGKQWYKGTLHNHTHKITSERGLAPPVEVAHIYKSAGYDFIALTDHDGRLGGLSWPQTDWESDLPDGFVVITGYEASYPGAHINCLNCLPEEVCVKPGEPGFIEAVHKAGGLTFLNHPSKWNDIPEIIYDSADLQHLDGLEIYSGARIVKEIALATKLWDGCLSHGLPLWGFANPDCHNYNTSLPDSPFNGYNVVLCQSLTKGDLMNALKEGSFYASTGVEVENIETTGSEIIVTTRNASKVKFIGANGNILRTVEGSSGRYAPGGDEGYVRVELENTMSCFPGLTEMPQRAWLQPILISG